jgi:hypothetical protein
MSITSRQITPEACDEYRYLLAKGYPDKAALKLVGDRHRLSRLERNCLFRGIVDDETAETRRRKMVSPDGARGSGLGIDWYNVLITAETYLKGGVLFLADDGVTRDAAAVHGSWRRSPVTGPATDAIVSALGRIGPGRIDVFLDSPVAFSGELAAELRGRIGEAVPGAACTVALAASADWPLKRYQGIVASSDSVVLDSAAKALDLPRHALEWRYGFKAAPIGGRRSP